MEPLLVQCWATVVDGGPWFHVSCLLVTVTPVQSMVSLQDIAPMLRSLAATWNRSLRVAELADPVQFAIWRLPSLLYCLWGAVLFHGRLGYLMQGVVRWNWFIVMGPLRPRLTRRHSPITRSLSGCRHAMRAGIVSQARGIADGIHTL